MTIRVLLVEDQPLMRLGVAVLLAAEDDIEVVGEVDDGEEAVRAVEELAPDVVLMDVRMPVMDGVEATWRMLGSREAGSPAVSDVPAVLIFTMDNTEDAVYAALRAGASGFLLKDAAPFELIAAVRAVAAGEAWLDPAVTRSLIDEFANRPYCNEPTPQEVASLTERELTVLVLLAQGQSNADIARALIVGEGTVKTHMSHILMKLGVHDRTQAVVAAYRCGLVSARSR